jgi:hypothetical protein
MEGQGWRRGVREYRGAEMRGIKIERSDAVWVVGIAGLTALAVVEGISHLWWPPAFAVLALIARIRRRRNDGGG